MSVILGLLLASGQALPFIDRSALHTLAKYEAAAKYEATSKSEGASDRVRFKRRVVASRDARVRSLCVRAAKIGGPVDLLAEVRQSYAMSAPKTSILASTCEVLRSDPEVKTASR